MASACGLTIASADSVITLPKSTPRLKRLLHCRYEGSLFDRSLLNQSFSAQCRLHRRPLADALLECEQIGERG